jgi:hypothetical protein
MPTIPLVDWRKATNVEKRKKGNGKTVGTRWQNEAGEDAITVPSDFARQKYVQQQQIS